MWRSTTARARSRPRRSCGKSRCSAGGRSLSRRTLQIAAAVARMVATVRDQLGPVDVLVNNAGSAGPQAWRDIQEADWQAVLDNNLTSAFLVTQTVLPDMCARRWGRIVNISSGAVQMGGVVGVHYTAAKAGMLGLTRAYAKVTVTDGVTVNAVAPALIDTEMRLGDRATRERMIPMGRLGTVEETAEAVMLLVRNGYMTGQTVHLNGGLYFTWAGAEVSRRRSAFTSCQPCMVASRQTRAEDSESSGRSEPENAGGSGPRTAPVSALPRMWRPCGRLGSASGAQKRDSSGRNGGPGRGRIGAVDD